MEQQKTEGKAICLKHHAKFDKGKIYELLFSESGTIYINTGDGYCLSSSINNPYFCFIINPPDGLIDRITNDNNYLFKI